MKKLLIVSALASAALASSAVAEDFTATIGVGGEVASIKGNAAKFKEYRDVGDGLTGTFDLEFFRKGYYFDLSGENFGYNSDTEKAYNDQKYTLKGGKYESFKYNFYYDEIPHNQTFGARSLFSGVGTTTLTAPVAFNIANNAGNRALVLGSYKNTFDYKQNRTNYGGGFEASFNSPLFLSVKLDRLETKGLYPIGIATPLSRNAKELPAPIDYATTTLNLQTGYKSKNLVATVDGTLSNFTNENDYFTYIYTNLTNRVTLPPDNKYYKFGGSVTYRIPFWNTALMARGSYSQNENNIALEGLNRSFDGKITYTTASFAATSNPTKNLDTRAFFNYLEKDNRSSEPFAYGGLDTEKFEYDKINTGIEAGYKLPAKTKITAGYEYLKMNRSIRTDARTTKDDIYSIKLKNSYLDWLTAKLSYQMMQRDSDYKDAALYSNVVATERILAYWRPFDTANKQQDTVKLGLDLEPMHNLAFGLEYSYKRNRYKDTYLGVKSDSRHGLYMDANVIAGILKFNPYADVETVDTYATHRRFTGTNGDPITGPNNATNFNWSSKRYDLNYALGLNTDVNIIKDKLTAFIGWRFEKSDGSEEFTSSFPAAGIAPPLINNTRVDNYVKDSLTAKLTYAVNKNMNVGVGYLFEKLQYSDDHWEEYSYVPGNAAAHLTGAYASPSYEAHVGWVNFSYKF